MTKTISIAGHPFEVSAPYLEGHPITAAEAKVLNQTRAENIGNNFREDVKKALADGTLEAVTAAIAAYDAEYQFTVSRVSRTPIDPIEAEAFKIAKEVVKQKLADKGIKVKDYIENETNAAKYDAALEKIAAQDDTLKLAKQRVAARKKVAEVASDDVDLG
jgi:hypothetical protein